MSFPVPSALLAGKEARRKQGVLLCSGLRIEGASGSSVSIQGLMNVRSQWSSQCSWSDWTLPYSASINGKGFTLEQLVGGGIVLTLQRYWTLWQAVVMREHLYIAGGIATYILYCYFWRVFLLNAPTFIVYSIPPFSVSVKQLTNMASATDPLVWHRSPVTFWWNVLPPLPNLLVSYPLPVHERERCAVGHKDDGVADHIVSRNGTIPLQVDGHRHCYGCWEWETPIRWGHRDPIASSGSDGLWVLMLPMESMEPPVLCQFWWLPNYVDERNIHPSWGSCKSVFHHRPSEYNPKSILWLHHFLVQCSSIGRRVDKTSSPLS